jgi:hypothetical protein
MVRDAAGARIDLSTVTTTVVSSHDHADAIETPTPDLTGPACWHVGRLRCGRGAAIERVRTARSHSDHALRDRAGPFRDLPCARRVAAGRRGASAICRTRVPRLSAVWMFGRRLCPLLLYRMRTGSPRGVFVQRARILSPVWWTPDGRAVGASHRSRVSGRTGSTMGVESAASAAVLARVGSRTVSRRDRRCPADGAPVPAPPRPR